ncbi:uncharacterized protein [Branchiostoma lanceolatum]|uniref:uncharacterized protein n=1 Tax=Branchiostoma lanceolatum TaxID=7740 RepID=UPI0034541D4A
MKFYSFNGAALALMELSLREGIDPDEGEILRVDPTFPTKSKLSKTGRVQKWREIKSKLVLGQDFVAHCEAPNHRLPAREDIERIFRQSHLRTNPECDSGASSSHRPWRETWELISSMYQTNVKKFGITREGFEHQLDTCSCKVSVTPAQPQTAQTTADGNDESESEDEFVGFPDESDSDSEGSETESYDLFEEMDISVRDPKAGIKIHTRPRTVSRHDYQNITISRDTLEEHIENLSDTHNVHLKVVHTQKTTVSMKIRDNETIHLLGTMKTFACHRAGTPRRKRLCKRRRRKSRAVGCSFRVKVFTPNDESQPLQVRLYPHHCNHTPGSEEDSCYMPVHQTVKQVATDCLGVGMTVQQTSNMLQSMQQSGTIEIINKGRWRTTLTRKELTQLQYEMRCSKRVHQDDWVGTYAKAERLRDQGVCIFFQEYDPDNEDPDKRPFVLVLQTEWQRQAAERFSPNSVWTVDSTFGLNSYGLPVFSAVVPNQNRQGLPIFYLITSNDKKTKHEETGVRLGFEALLERMSARPNAIIIDKSLTEKRAIESAVQNDPLSWEDGTQSKCHLLLCWFHVKKAWTENLLPKLEGQMAADVYEKLCGLMMHPTWQGFEENLEQFYSEFENAQQVTKYMRGWDCDEWRSMWVCAGRMFPHGDTDTTNLVERHWELIKYTTLNGRANHRLDVLMDALIGNPDDGTFHGGQSSVGFYMEKQKEVDMGLHSARATVAERNRQSRAEMYMQAHSKDSSVLRLQSEALLLFKIKSSSKKGVRYNVCLTTMICDCSDNFNNAIICKHICACRLYVHKFKPHLLANIAPPDARNPTSFLVPNCGSSTDNTDETTESQVPTPESSDICEDLDNARLQVEATLRDMQWEGMTSYQAAQTTILMKNFVKQLQTVQSVQKPLTRDERVVQARLVRTIQQANTAARRPTSSTQDPDTQPANRIIARQPDQQTKHRKKIKQTHKRIVLPGEHHSKFKRVKCANCGTSNYVCVNGKATEATTTCKNCDEEVTWACPKDGHK